MGDVTATFAPTYCEMMLDNFPDFPEGRKVVTCIQCEMCTGTCSYGEVMDCPP
jgi:heterodisulfide reductase subunit C